MSKIYVVVWGKAFYDMEDEYDSVKAECGVYGVFTARAQAEQALAECLEANYNALSINAKHYKYIHECGSADHGWFELSYETKDNIPYEIRMEIVEEGLTT